jgi:hypothetical protein
LIGEVNRLDAFLPLDAPGRQRRKWRFDWIDMNTEFDLLTLADVAKLLHCSKAHVTNAVAGRVRGCPPIPAISLGRRKLVRRESLLSWIAENDKIPSSPERGRKSA